MPALRKSLDDHKLTGTKPAYVEEKSEVAAGRPKFPKKNFTSEMKSTYKRIVRLLETRRTCTQGDAEIIRLFCVAVDRHARALDHLTAEGEVCAYTRLDSNGQPHTFYKESLWLKICTDAEKFQLSALDRLGLTPMNRGKVKKTTKPEPKPDDAAAALFSRDAEQQPVEDEPNLNDIHEELIN